MRSPFTRAPPSSTVITGFAGPEGLASAVALVAADALALADPVDVDADVALGAGFTSPALGGSLSHGVSSAEAPNAANRQARRAGGGQEVRMKSVL